ncbi:alpha/beta hydrolase [Pseudoalteromonas fenneropenaei]|uniref:Alpha/beta hydrolase n=1 Tax=Pseudoalteromonas fenneropenaei TaxID=1737459 RepID=A0ABV7CJM0_9GAMM
MSSKIYFSSKSARKPLSYYGIRALSSSMATLAPALALKHTKKLLLTPVRSRKREPLPVHFSQSELITDEGKLQLSAVGSGKTIVLTHGWSGSSAQFYPLMAKIAEAGYRALAFDHFGHGQSQGQFANLPLFIKGLKAVLAEVPDAVGVVSHSMGTVAALNAVKHLPQVLIAPTFGFYESFRERILTTGISERLFERVLTEVEQEHEMQFLQLLPEQHLALQQCKVHAIHDTEDRFAPFQLSAEQARQHTHFMLTSASQLGHGRIISAEPTWQLIKQQLL